MTNREAQSDAATNIVNAIVTAVAATQQPKRGGGGDIMTTLHARGANRLRVERGRGILNSFDNKSKGQQLTAADLCSLDTSEVSMLTYPLWILTRNPLYANHQFSITHNQLDRAFQWGGVR